MITWFTPWRMSYLTAPRPETSGCLFCRMAGEDRDRENLILHRGPKAFVVLNRYPYTNGHLMVVPYSHQARIAGLAAQERSEVMQLASACEAAIEQAYRPDGLNAGMNLGTAAGAGIEGHLHLHILPRWHGDTNFLTVTGETRIIPEDLATTFERLAPLVRARAGA